MSSSVFSAYTAISLLPDWCKDRERDFFWYAKYLVNDAIEIPIERDADYAILSVTAIGGAGFFGAGTGDIPSRIPDGIIRMSEVTTGREWSNIPLPLQSCVGFGGFISGVTGPPFEGLQNYQYVLPCPWIVPRRGVVRIRVVESVIPFPYYGGISQIILGGVKIFGPEHKGGFVS